MDVLYSFALLVHAYKYGLGSCSDQSLDQAIWPAIQKGKLDGFIFLGDNVYGDQPNTAFLKMKMLMKFKKLDYLNG